MRVSQQRCGTPCAVGGSTLNLIEHSRPWTMLLAFRWTLAGTVGGLRRWIFEMKRGGTQLTVPS